MQKGLPSCMLLSALHPQTVERAGEVGLRHAVFLDAALLDHLLAGAVRGAAGAVDVDLLGALG